MGCPEFICWCFATAQSQLTTHNKGRSKLLEDQQRRNQFFNLGLLISIFSQSYYLITGFFRRGTYFTARPDDYSAIFDGRQLVMHVAIVVGALEVFF